MTRLHSVFMAIHKTGKWWAGSSPDDIKDYLEAYSANGYQSEQFCLARCTCGSFEFRLEADDDEGVAKRTCIECGKEHFICDSAEYWEDAKPQLWKCVECESEAANVGVGFSLYEDREAVRWLYIGERCSTCGVLGCFAGWKIGYAPSLQLLDEV